MLVLDIPPGPLHEIQDWVEKQNVEFFLYDALESITIPWNELVATCSIPLARVLLSSKKPLNAVFKMSTLGGELPDTDIPRLEIAIYDTTQERWTWAKVVDATPSVEEVWEVMYADKMKADMATKTKWNLKMKMTKEMVGGFYID